MLSESRIREAVRNRYARLATTLGEVPSGCCEPASSERPESDVPQEASQVSAGCGTPVYAAEILAGEVVVDLGSGGGIDCFRASKLVGQNGLVIGVDATPEMIWRGRETAEKHGYRNVEFRLGEIEHLPLESNSVDVIISNCVLNLAPDKGEVFREAYRVLKPGGRLVISDMMARDLRKIGKADDASWAACIAGAIPLTQYLTEMREAGFTKIETAKNSGEDSCCGSGDVVSVTVKAVKALARPVIEKIVGVQSVTVTAKKPL